MNFFQKFKNLILSSLLLLVSACGSGCIDPEDYGGYYTEILTISADGISSNDCVWNPNKLSTDDVTNGLSYGADISDILRAGSPGFLKSLGCSFGSVRYDSNNFPESDRSNCFEEAARLCRNRKLIEPSSNVFWKTTTLKDDRSDLGLKLHRGAKIFISAKGDISFTLGAKEVTAFFGTNYNYDSSIGHNYKQSSGKLVPGFYDVKDGDIYSFFISGQIDNSQGSPADISSNWSNNAHTGFSRLYAYLQEFPTGYLSGSGDSEQVRAIGDYPIEPDPRLWNCFPVINANFTARNDAGSGSVTNCFAQNYKYFYGNLQKRNIVNDDVKNPDQSLILKIQDNVYVEKYGTEYDITNPQNLAKYGGAILNNEDGTKDGEILSKNSLNVESGIAAPDDQYRFVTYKNNCTISITEEVVGTKPVSVASPEYNGSSEKAILYPGQSAKITVTDTNCDVKIRDLKHLEIKESGYVRFFNNSLQNGKTCNLKISISNKDTIEEGANSVIQYYHEKFQDNGDITDFEKTINVKSKPSGSNNIKDFLKNISDPIYLRKGQHLLFLPDSWKWNNNGGCDINTLMHIEHRPAVICKMVKEYDAANIACSHIIENCQDDDPDCVNNKKKVCANSSQSPTIKSDYKCFNVTNYKNKLGDIDLLNSLPIGVAEIPFFDGVKGNFTEIYNANSINNNRLSLVGNQSEFNLYKLKSDNNIQFTKDGRLKFLFLSNENHLELGRNASDLGSNYFSPQIDGNTNYNGLNGFQINFGYSKTHSNGENLQIVLCDDNSASGNCRSSNPLEKIIIKDDLNHSNNYVFKKSGTLIDVRSNKYKDHYTHQGFGNNDDKLRFAFNIHNSNQDIDGNNCIIGRANNTAKSCSSNKNCGTENNQPCCNGKLIDNPYYTPSYCLDGTLLVAGKCCPIGNVNNNSSVCNPISSAQNAIKSNSNNVCQFLSPDCQDGKICVGPNYGNFGFYKVTVNVANIDGPDTLGIISGIISPILDFFDGSGEDEGFIKRVYEHTVQNSIFVALVRLFSVFMLIFFGVSYFMGLSDMKQQQWMMMTIKLGIIYLLISPDSWYWYKVFFVDTLKDGINYITFLMANTFDRDPAILGAINNYDFSDKTLLFKSSDRMFRLLFESTIHKKILALIFNNFFGIIYVIFIYWGIFHYLKAFFASLAFFLIAQSLISILLLYGPIFIILIFFKRTENFFKTWYEQLLGIALQQILIVLFLSFFNGIIYELIKMNFNYRICWGTVWDIPIINVPAIFKFWSLPATGVGLSSDPALINGAPNLIAIIFIFFMCKLMYDFIGLASKLSATIIGNLQLGSNAIAMTSKAIKSMKISLEATKNYFKKTAAANYLVSRKNQFLDKHFDIGKDADERHSNQQKANKLARSKELALRAAGDQSDKKYLKDRNITDTRKLTTEQKQDMQKKREEALEKKAGDLGIDIDSEEGKKEFKDLKEARGSKFTDRDLNNPLYAALNKMQQYDKNFARSRRADQSKYHDEEVAEGKKKSELKPKLADPNRPPLDADKNEDAKDDKTKAGTEKTKSSHLEGEADKRKASKAASGVKESANYGRRGGDHHSETSSETSSDFSDIDSEFSDGD